MSYVHPHYEPAWLDVNRLTLEERRCQENKIFYRSAIPLLVHIAHAKLHLPPFLTVPHNGSFSPLPFPPPYGPMIACKCFQYVPTYLLKRRMVPLGSVSFSTFWERKLNLITNFYLRKPVREKLNMQTLCGKTSVS